jgi:hypothetical protein
MVVVHLSDVEYSVCRRLHVALTLYFVCKKCEGCLKIMYSLTQELFMAVGTPKGFQQLWAQIMGTDLQKGDPWPVLCGTSIVFDSATFLTF